MPVIHVEMFGGRNREQKEKFAKAITESFVSICGGTPQSVQVIFSDVSKDDWATAGVLASTAAAQKSPAKAD
jgi:4-oxalocrotonate tautomerase